MKYTIWVTAQLIFGYICYRITGISMSKSFYIECIYGDITIIPLLVIYLYNCKSYHFDSLVGFQTPYPYTTVYFKWYMLQ